MPELEVTASSKDFYTKDGTKVSADVWADAIKTEQETLGYDTLDLDKLPITVFTRWTGIDHGDGKCWELGVTGDSKNQKHAVFHGRHEIYADKTLAQAAHLKAVDDIKKAGGTLPGVIADG